VTAPLQSLQLACGMVCRLTSSHRYPSPSSNNGSIHYSSAVHLMSDYHLRDTVGMPSERSKTGGYTVFIFVCLSACLCTLSPVLTEWCIVRQEMYSTHVWKVDNISVRTRYCWKRRFIGFPVIGSRLKWGFRRNVQKCNSYIAQNGFTAARRAAMSSWDRPVHSLFIDCGPVGLH